MANENFTPEGEKQVKFLINYAEVLSWGAALGDDGKVTSYGFVIENGSTLSGVLPEQLGDVIEPSSLPASMRGQLNGLIKPDLGETEKFVIALSDADGKIIAGSEFPGFFDLIGDAFDALSTVAVEMKNAAVFCRPLIWASASSSVSLSDGA